jgi:hypothetical protein
VEESPQTTWQPAPTQLQVDEPSQVNVHDPAQVALHVLLPVHVDFDPSPSVTVHCEPPPQSTLLPGPSDC